MYSSRIERGITSVNLRFLNGRGVFAKRFVEMPGWLQTELAGVTLVDPPDAFVDRVDGVAVILMIGRKPTPITRRESYQAMSSNLFAHVQ